MAVIKKYKLVGIALQALEKLLNKILSCARLGIPVKHRFGKPLSPRVWFLVPLSVTDVMVELLRKDKLSEWFYDPQTATLRPLSDTI